MSDYTTTPNYGLYKPTPNADYDLWGDHLNANADKLDQVIRDIAVASGGGVGGGRDIWITDFLPAGQPDGTTDLTSYFQQALDAAAGADPTDRAGAPGVARLIVPANTNAYIIGASLYIPSNSHIVIAQGSKLKLIDNAPQTSLLDVSGASNVIIELYGTLDGNRLNQPGRLGNSDGNGVNCGIGGANCSNIFITGNRQGVVQNFKNWPVNLNGPANNVEVRGIAMQDSGNSCEIAGITTPYTVVSSANSSYNSTTGVISFDTGALDHGIKVGQTFVYWQGAVPSAILAGEYVAVTVATTTTPVGHVVTALLTRQFPNANGPITTGVIGGSQRCTNVGFVDCSVKRIPDVALLMYSGCNGGYIRGCEITQCASAVSIYADNAQPASCSDCEISDCYTHDSYGGGPQIINNPGGATHKNIRIRNNVVANCFNGGIIISDVDGAEVVGNTVCNSSFQTDSFYTAQMSIKVTTKNVNVVGNMLRDPGLAVLSHTTTICTLFSYNSATGATSLQSQFPIGTFVPHNIAVGDKFFLQIAVGTGDCGRLEGWQTATAGTDSTTSVLNFTAPTGLVFTLNRINAQQFTYAVPVSNIVPGTYTSDSSGNMTLTTDIPHGYPVPLKGFPFVLSGVASIGGTVPGVGGITDYAGVLLNGAFKTATGTTGTTLVFVTKPNATVAVAGGRVLPPNYGIGVNLTHYTRITDNHIGDYQTTPNMTACIGGVWSTRGVHYGNRFGLRQGHVADVSTACAVEGINYDTGLAVGNLSIAGQITFAGVTGNSSTTPSFYPPQGLTPAWNYHVGRGEVDFFCGQGPGIPGGFDFLQVTVIQVKAVGPNTYSSATGNVSLTTTIPHTVLPGGMFSVGGLTGTDGNYGNDLIALAGVQTANSDTTGSTLTYTVDVGLTVATITGGMVKPVGTGGGTVNTGVGVAGSLLANDGYGNTRLGGALVHGTMQTATLAAGGTVTVNPNTSLVLVQNSSSIAAGSVVLPAPGAGSYQLAGSELEVRFSNPVGTLTMTAAPGAGVAGPPIAVLSAGSSFRFVLSEPGNIWLPRLPDVSGTAPVGGPYLALSGGAVTGATTFGALTTHAAGVTVSGGTLTAGIAVFTGAVTAPTPPVGDSDTSVATTAFVTGLSLPATGTPASRTLADRFADVVNVKDFGAIFDGTSHPLSAFYGTLAAAQAVYPHAVALTDEIDGVAIQAAINFCAARVTNYSYGGEVRLPVGTGRINQPLVINKATISLRAPGGGVLFRSNVAITLPSTATRLLWTGAARTVGQGQINMLTVEPLLADLRMLAANNVTGIVFDCNFVVGAAGPVFRSVRESTIEIGTNEPNGIPYPGAVLTAGSNTIAVSTTVGVRVGESIVSASLPEGAYVASIVDGTHLTTSILASASSTETVTIGGEGVRFDVVGGLQDSNSTREIKVRYHGMSQLGLANATAPMCLIGGSGTLPDGSGTNYGNTCISSIEMWICFNNGPAVVINNSDHLIFPAITTLHIGSGTSSAIVSNGSRELNNGGARYNKFGYVSGRQPILFTGTDTGGFVSGSVGNAIEFLDLGNASSVPVVGVGASVSIGADNSSRPLTLNGSTYPVSANFSDGTALGGDPRGLAAADLQSNRATSSQVASGRYSTIAGGKNNTASADWSSVVGGDANTASNQFAIVLGGGSNTASGTYSAVIAGSSSSASQTYAVASGGNVVADLYGARAHGSGLIAAGRRAQTYVQVLRAVSAANTTPVRLTADGLVAGAFNVANLTYSTQGCTISVQLIAVDPGGTNFYSWTQPLGLLTRQGTVGNTVYTPGTPATLVRGTTAGIVITEAADTVNGGYSLTFTPPTGNTALWRVVATVTWTRVDGT